MSPHRPSPAIFSSSMLPNESRTVSESPPIERPSTLPLLVVTETRPLMSAKVTLPKLLEIVAMPATVEISTLPLLS